MASRARPSPGIRRSVVRTAAAYLAVIALALVGATAAGASIDARGWMLIAGGLPVTMAISGAATRSLCRALILLPMLLAGVLLGGLGVSSRHANRVQPSDPERADAVAAARIFAVLPCRILDRQAWIAAGQGVPAAVVVLSPPGGQSDLAASIRIALPGSHGAIEAMCTKGPTPLPGQLARLDLPAPGPP
ncbi:MAG: hypothetical protein AAGE01_11115 [Pseudomonadota bacterium]